MELTLTNKAIDEQVKLSWKGIKAANRRLEVYPKLHGWNLHFDSRQNWVTLQIEYTDGHGRRTAHNIAL